MADSENTPSAPAKPNDDPALAMSTLWHAETDELEKLASVASRRERAMFDAPSDQRQEAEGQFLEAAKARDRLSDRLETMSRGIFKTPAQSFKGAAAKLSVAIRENVPSKNDPTPPWPAFRSVQADLDRLVALTKSA